MKRKILFIISALFLTNCAPQNAVRTVKEFYETDNNQFNVEIYPGDDDNRGSFFGYPRNSIDYTLYIELKTAIWQGNLSGGIEKFKERKQTTKKVATHFGKTLCKNEKQKYFYSWGFQEDYSLVLYEYENNQEIHAKKMPYYVRVTVECKRGLN